MKRLAALLWAAGLASGCAGRMQAARLGVERVEIRRVLASGAHLEVWFQVENEGPQELLLEGLECELELDGHKVGACLPRGEMNVAGHGHMTTSAQVEVAFLVDQRTGLTAILERKEVLAVMSGHYMLREAGVRRRVSFQARGRVPLEREESE